MITGYIKNIEIPVIMKGVRVEISNHFRPEHTDIRKITVMDDFFAPYIEKIRTVTTPDVFRKFIKDGAVENYERVARGEKGGHAGPPWYHGLICEVIRGVSDMLAVRYDAEIDKQLDEIIDSIRRAIDADEEGWLHPYDTLMCPDKRFGLNGGNARFQHETYDMGCMVEAGVHHYRATGKTTMLEAAVRNANYFTDRIGEGKWNIVCEHSIAEMALASLDELFVSEPELEKKVGAKRGEYLKLAKFFIDNRGVNENRHQFPPFLQEYAQDYRPGREQREAVGHAVRATLFYTGMADVAMAADDAGLAEAAVAIWKDITETKLHINGSVGSHAVDEKFGQQYELPNNAYLETCAGVGFMFFGASVFRLTGDGSVWDSVEKTITNLLPAAVSEDGTHYTYENPLETKGGFERWSWHGCPCCPPMLLKAVGVMPSYFFSACGDTVWMNLYIDSDAELDGVKLSLKKSDNGKKLTVNAERNISLKIRVPEWARGFSLAVNGKPYKHTVEKSYAGVVICPGSMVIDIIYDTPAVKIAAHPYVGADRGRVAVQRGPVLYCCEKAVEKWEDLDPVLSTDRPVYNSDGTVTVTSEYGTEFTLTEYRRWNNNGALPMRTWFRQKGWDSEPSDLEGWEHRLYREWKYS